MGIFRGHLSQRLSVACRVNYRNIIPDAATMQGTFGFTGNYNATIIQVNTRFENCMYNL